MSQRLKIAAPFDDALRAALDTPLPGRERSQLEVVRAADVTPLKMPLVWRGRLPVGTLSVIGGKPGLGKSTLATAIAAELSRAGSDVIISNAEDDPATVIRPRLDVAGADLARVHLVPAMSAPLIPRDLDQLEALIRDTDAKALFLDPIGAHFKPEVRVHDRPTLRRLIEVARATGCAVVGIHHTIKAGSSADGSLITAIGGPSGGLSGSARAVYLYGYDPADEDRRALVCAKANGFDEPPALIVSHETVEYRSSGRVLEAGMLRFVTESNARNVLRRGRSRPDRDADAVSWLGAHLLAADECERRVTELRVAGDTAGFGWQTLQRARITLALERRRTGGWGANGYWLWKIPESHPLRAPSHAIDVSVADGEPVA